MKEASGEASMTGVTLVVIAVIAAVAVPIVRSLITNTQAKAECASNGGEWSGEECTYDGLAGE